jgi:hypothetical protein
MAAASPMSAKRVLERSIQASRNGYPTTRLDDGPLRDAMVAIVNEIEDLKRRLTEHEERRCLLHPGCVEDKNMGRVCWDKRDEERQ